MYASVAVMREREREETSLAGKMASEAAADHFLLFRSFFFVSRAFRVFLMGPYTVSVTLCVNAGLSFSFFVCGSNLV